MWWPDRPYEGNSAAGVKAYLSGANSTLHPPIIKAKQILEREPGNKYEDQNSEEQVRKACWLDVGERGDVRQAC